LYIQQVYEVDSFTILCELGFMTEAVEMRIEPEVAEELRKLRREATNHLRVVLKAVARVKALTGVGEVATLGDYLSEVSTVEAERAKTDGRVQEALERGAEVRRKLVEAEGGSLSAENAARGLNMTKAAVLKRYHNGRLLGWRDEKQNAVRFPVWQFKDGKVLTGIETVLESLKPGPQLDDFGRLLFFLSNSRFLGGKRPLDCLREGELHRAVQAAEGYGS
jgi:hypothetical protein